MTDIKELEGVDVKRLVKTRVNQSIFRTMVLNNYDSKCCITGIDIPDFLVASHIVPWSKNEKERLNPMNGLCLNSLHDKAFDKGFLTIMPDYKIKISSHLKTSFNNEAIDTLFTKYNNQQIQVPEKFVPSKDFLDYHYDVIFKK